MALTGQMVDGTTGKPVQGVVITAGGARATSNGEGLWDLSAPLESAVKAVDITVQAPGQSGYTIKALPVQALTMRGDAQHVGRWTSVPYARFEATLVRRGVPVIGASVSFAPTGGAPVRPVTAESVTNGAGIFGLELAGTGALGPVLGTLTVMHPSFGRPSRLDGFSVPLDYRYDIPRSVATLAVGGLRTYGGEVIFRGSGQKAPGARVEFVRTGGVAMTPATVQVTADERGFFVLSLDATVDGTVVGDLTVRSADGARASTYRSVSFATYDSTSYRNSGLWAFGERWAWAMEVWTHDRLAAAPNLNVEFHRTGGLMITPATFAGRTGSDGRIELKAEVADTGTVIGELVVFAVAGATRVISNVRLRTFESDELRFAGVFGVGPALRYVGEVLQQDGTPVQGAQVTWTQTSGIPASPSVLTVATDASGRFPLTLIPSLDGEVVGTVRVVPPAPWAAGTSFTFTNLRLNSFENGELRLAVTYRIPAP
jgi:hypothetical protein